VSFDRTELIAALDQHSRVVRVVIADIKGSSPREIGASMLVWKDGQSGTIGGGALEFQMTKTARLATKSSLSTHALGPEMGQCCGGAVTLLTEVFTKADTLPEDVFARGTGEMPLGVSRVLADARAKGERPKPQMISGWMVEPITKPQRHLWVWGAGHVGSAIVATLCALPDFQITWVDTDRSRFPQNIPAGIDAIPATDPTLVINYAPKSAEHLILTYSHDLDLKLCHSLLTHGFGFTGLIGSKTKWARFKTRLERLGHTPNAISRITCPIGDPSLGKHPQAIALGVGAALMKSQALQHLGERRA